MPRKVRQRIADLGRAGFVNRGGKRQSSQFHACEGRAADVERESRRGRQALSGTRREARCGRGERL